MKNFKFKLILTSLLLCLFSFLPLSVNGAGLLLDWTKQLGGAGNNYSTAIAVDSVGNSYNTGYFLGTVDSDPGAAVVNLTSAGAEDFFVSKLDVNGDFVWVKQIGGAAGDDDAYNINIDPSGDIYVTGYFMGTVDFDPGVAVSNLVSVGSYDSFVLKLDSSGNFVWAKQSAVTAGLSSLAHSVDFDSLGNVYVTGRFAGVADVFGASLTSAGSNDIYVVKLEADGNIVWGKQMGGVGSEAGDVVSFDSSGFIYVSGSFAGTADFDPGAGTSNLISAGGNDVFVAKLDLNGDLVWARRMGGAGADASYFNDGGSSVDSSGSIYTTGTFNVAADFGATTLTSAGGRDFFINKLDSDGNFVWTKQIGAAGNEGQASSTLDSSGNIYAGGYFNGTVDFDPGVGTANLSAVPANDNFVLKLDSDGNFVWVEQVGGQGALYISVAGDGSNYITGGFTGTTDFDPGAGTSNLISAGGNDVFVSKLTPEDTTPVAFTFTDQTDVSSTSSIESNTITVSGINIATPISITSCTGTVCEYSINSGAYTSVDGTVENGDTVKVHQTSSSNVETVTNLTLSIGGVTDVFNVTTSAPVTPVSSSGSYMSGYYRSGRTVTTTTTTTSDTSTEPVAKFTFTKNLRFSQTGNEVKELQKFLNAHNYSVAMSGVGSPGFETNYFGSLTKKAVIRFQLANNLVGDGIVGPLTRAVLNK